MDTSSLKKEMQSSIAQSAVYLPPQMVFNGLNTYRLIFGCDDFFQEYALAFSRKGPLISLICLNCADDYVDEFLSRQLYSNLEVVRTAPDDSFSDIIQYIASSDSKYLCFCEPNYLYDSSRVFDMVSSFEQLSSVDLIISPRNFMDPLGNVIAFDGLPASNSEADCSFNGRLLLQDSINQNVNMYGSLSTLMAATQYAKKVFCASEKNHAIFNTSINAVNSLAFLFHLLLNGRGRRMYVPTSIASAVLQPFQDETSIQKAYEDFAVSFASQNEIALSPNWNRNAPPISYSSIRKEITFFYTDMGEYYNLKPIADAASRRGYQTDFTQNITQKAEIGIYCQHGGYPENSRFSAILLHDLAQRHDCWPNIWTMEHWNNYDLGIVPGRFWASLWKQSACFYYANPRRGTYEFGYPKSDLVGSVPLKSRAEELRQQLRLPYDISILYAPSWENDGKEEDFVRSLASLKANLLIKQAQWPPQYQSIINNIRQMRAMHEGKYDNVYYIEPTESIMTALELCDIVVSEESSVMAEALMFHKPSIAVTDWLMPDGDSTRPANMPVDYIVKCTKEELREYVEKFCSNPSCYDATLQKGDCIFSNQGHVCDDILDAIEYYAFGKSTASGKKTDCGFFSKKLASKYTICSMWN